MIIESLPILEILKLGLVGLTFLLCLLSFILLYTEQKRKGDPRKKIIVSIYVYMGLTFFFFIGNVGLDLYQSYRTEDELIDENKGLKSRVTELENKEKLFKKTWIINGTFNLDFNKGGKDISFFTIPPTEINTYVTNNGFTGFTITNFRAIIMNDEIVFPVLGFQSTSFCSQGTIDISDEASTKSIVNLNNPISFVPIHNNGGQ